MRRYSLRYSLSDIQRQYAEETYQRAASFDKGVRESNPDIAQNIANISKAYPTIPKEILPYVALSGVTAEDQLALDLANRSAEVIARKNAENIVTNVNWGKRGVQLGFLGLDAVFQNISRGFKSSVVAAQQTGRSVPGVVAAATLGGLAETVLPGQGETTANFLNNVYGGGVGTQFKAARDRYGKNEFRLALDQIKKGKPLNLGTGFIPKSLDLKQTQVFLDETRRGKSEAEAYQSASDRYGMPITQLYDKREDAYKYTTKEGTKVNISPGRIAAVQMAEPGSLGYNVVSGVIDGVFRLAGDPTNLALMYGAGVKTAMRTLVSANQKAVKAAAPTTTFWKTFVPGKTGRNNRALYYGRDINDIRQTKWGQDFGKAIAQLKGDEGMAFLNDVREFNKIPPSVKEVLLAVDDPQHVWDVLEIVAKGGNLTDTQFDNVFTLLKQYVPKKVQAELDRVRELSVNNVTFGLDAIPARPTAMGELFNTMFKIMGGSTDVAPLRKFAGMFLSKDDPARGLLGSGTQLARSGLMPRHVRRAMQLRPETLMVISDIEAAARNTDEMLKLSFADAKTRGAFTREVLQATTQAELDEITFRVNKAIANSVAKQNPNLKIDVEDLIKQQENFNSEIEMLRDFFGNSAGGSIAFNGAKIQKRVDKFVADVQKHFELTGVEVPSDEAIRYVFEAVPSMHLLSQASKSFVSNLIDPRDVLQATKAHQTLIGPADSFLRAWASKPRQILDMQWADALKIPRKALASNASSNRLTLKPKGPIDSLFDDLQNKLLKPAWMFRLALALRIAPEEALRAAYGGKINAFTHPLKRLAMTSNKSLGWFGERTREDKVAQLYNSFGEIVFTTQMSPDDIKFITEIIDTDTLKAFQTMEYPQIEKLLKSYLLGTNYNGQVSDYMINAAVNNVALKSFIKEGVSESKLNIATKKIKANAKGNITGYDGNTYASMGEAIEKSGGFSVDLDVAKYLDMQKRAPSDADVFVSTYKDKEFPLGTVEDITKQANKQNISISDFIDNQIDNLFFDDETVALLSKQNHVLGVYTDSDGVLMLDVSIGLKGDNAIDNAVFLGMNTFQESIYVAPSGRSAAIDAGYNNVMTSDGSIFLYRKQLKEGEVLTGGAGAINYDSVIAKEALEVLYKNNFDALSIKVSDVEGAGRGMPGGNLFSGDETYQMSMGENAVIEGLLGNRKDLIENLFIRVNKRTQNENIMNPQYWEGLWTEIGEILAPDPITVRLLNLGKDEMMDYLRTNPSGKRLLKEFVERSHNPDDIAFLTDDKALREYLESIEYRVGIAVGNPTAKILDPFTGKELDASMTGRVHWRRKQKVYPKFVVDLSTTENTKLYQFIKNGGFLEGKDWVRYKEHINTMNLKQRGQANAKFYEEFIELFNDEVNLADLGPKTVARRFNLKDRINDDGTIIAGEKITPAGFVDDFKEDGLMALDPILETVYGALISKPSNWLNRDPLFRYAFYDNAKEVMRFMDDATAAEFLQGSKTWIEGTSLYDELLKIAKEPKLENTVTSLEQAEELLKHAAMNEVKTLFYSTSQRHIASDLFSKYIPFPEIWAEVFKTWGTLIVDNPQKFNRTRIAVDNGTEATPWDDENGFMTTDPRTGKLMFNYVDALNVLTLGTFKALGKITEMAGVRDALPDIVTSPYQTTVFGEDLTEEGVRVQAPGFAAGLNLVAQNGFAPGFGPLVQMPMKFFIDRLGSGKAFRKFFLGEFESSGRLTDIVQPAWLKKFRLFLSGEDIADKDMQRTFASTAMDLYTAYVLAGIVDQSDPDSVTAGVKRATEQARAVFGFRAAAQFALPTAVQPRIEVEDKNGQWWGVQVLVNKYQEMLIKNGYDHFETQQMFIEKYGVNPIPLKQPGSYRIGKQPIKENSFLFWQNKENKELLRDNNLPNTAYYIYPDKIEDELFYPAYYETRAQNITTGQYASFMRETQMIFEYEKGKADIRDSGKTNAEQEADLSILKESIQEEYGGFDMFNFAGKPTSVTTLELMGELRRWNNFDATKNSPENVYVQKYLDYRDELIDVILKGGTFKYGDLEIEVENKDGKIYYTYEETDDEGRTKVVRKRSQKKARTLNGTSQITIDAREIMTEIWNDLVNEGKDTNYPQLANEVLFYELSPTNSANESK